MGIALTQASGLGYLTSGPSSYIASTYSRNFLLERRLFIYAHLYINALNLNIN
jgi:hypothetical protein